LFKAPIALSYDKKNSDAPGISLHPFNTFEVTDNLCVLITNGCWVSRDHD